MPMMGKAGHDRLLLRERLLRGAPSTREYEAALRRWFEPFADLPPAISAAGSVRQLLDDCGFELRPRALELSDLLVPPCAGTGRTQTLWVALDRGGDALALRLSTWIANGAVPGLAADVEIHGSAERDVAYRRAEAAACRVLESRHPGAAVRYSLATGGGDPYMDSISDGSLGAALAVAALGTCRRHSLFGLDSRGAISGSLTSDGHLGGVDQRGLRSKAMATRAAGGRKLVVPPGQSDPLPGISGLRVREASKVDEARRQLSTPRPIAYVLLIALLAAFAFAGALGHRLRSESQGEKRRALAVQRAMARALDLVDEHPRAALELTAAAGLLEPETTEASRSLIAVALPPGLRFLPGLPSPATAATWTRSGISVVAGGRLLKLSRDHSHWKPGRALPPYEDAAFCGGDCLVIGSRDGATVLDLGDGTSKSLTAAPVDAVAGGPETAAALTHGDRVIVLRAGRRELLRPSGAETIAQIAVSPQREVVAIDGIGRVLRQRGGALVAAEGDVPVSPSFRRLTGMAAEGQEVVASDPNGAVFTRGPGGPDGIGSSGEAVAALLALPDRRGVVVRRDGSAEVFVTDGGYATLNTEHHLHGNYRVAAVSPGGRQLVLAGRDVALMRLDDVLPSPLFATESVVFGPGGQLFGLGRLFGGVLRLGREPPTVLVPAPKQVSELGGPVFSNDGRWAAQMEPKGRVRQFDLWTGKTRVSDFDYPTYEGPVDEFSQYMGVLDDGRLVLSRSEDEGENDEYLGTTYLADIGEKRVERLSYNGYGPFARELPRGRLLLASGEHVELIRLEDMKEARRVTVRGAYVNTLTATANGQTVFFGTSSGDVWKWEPGVEGNRPEHLGQVDGSILSLVADDDGSVLFGTANQDLRTPALIFAVDVANAYIEPLDTPEMASVSRLALSPDQRRIAISGTQPIGAELLNTWLTPEGACRRAGGEVTAKEWERAIGGLSVTAPACPGR